jgi:hypothetical protein
MLKTIKTNKPRSKYEGFWLNKGDYGESLLCGNYKIFLIFA